MTRTIAKDHDAKRDLVLKTAARLFSAQGVDRASMSRVATACGISKANIYHYYNSKNSLLFAMLDTYLKNLRDRVCAIELAHLKPDERFRATLSRSCWPTRASMTNTGFRPVVSVRCRAIWWIIWPV